MVLLVVQGGLVEVSQGGGSAMAVAYKTTGSATNFSFSPLKAVRAILSYSDPTKQRRGFPATRYSQQGNGIDIYSLYS